MTERILVGFDGSDTSMSAVAWATDEAARRGASLHIVSTYQVPVATDYYGIGIPSGYLAPELFRDACVDQLQRALGVAHERHPEVGVDIEALAGHAPDVLEQLSSSAAMVVVGSSGAGATKSFLLGSVCAAVLHRSPSPVVVVPTKLHDRAMSKIVVGVDGSTFADDAVRWATDEADRCGAHLDVVHAWSYLYERPDDGRDRVTTLADVDAAMVVERAVELSRERGSGDVTGRVLEGGAVDALIDASETSDMIVVGTRGRGGFRSMLFGSVAQHVATHASCPVAVIR